MDHNDDYQTGYKNPPKANQFKKGQSGNPKGRPRKIDTKELSFNEAFEHILNQSVSLKQDGKITTISKKEALVQVIINKGLQGELPALRLFISYLEKSSKRKEDAPRQIPKMVINPPRGDAPPMPPIYTGEDNDCDGL